MKPLLFSLAFGLSAFTLPAQSFERLDINHFNAGFNAAGDQLSMIPNFSNGVMVPFNQITFSIGNLWIGGYDAGNQLHMAAQTYRQTGTDFWAGPLDTTTATCSLAENAFYNKVWKINKTTIDSFRLGLFTSIPASISSWPGNGNAAAGEEHNMAPYVDVDGDGLYNPNNGDYPQIRGDQALFFVYNDNLIGQSHTETNGAALRVEIKCMAYAVACSDSALANTIFMHYDIINRNTIPYDSTILGLWTDLDVGPSYNNGVGSDSLQNNFYFYSDYFAAGALFLNQGMAGTMTYNNDFSVTGNPVATLDYYNYLHNRFKDGTPLTYGGSGHGGMDTTTYFYTGNPYSGTGWVSGTPVDRKMMGVTAPFFFSPGAVYSIDMAYVAANDPSMTTNLCVTNLRQRMQAIKTYYNLDITPCSDNLTSIPQQTENAIGVFPNPTNSSLTIHSANAIAQPYFIYNVAGQVVQTGTTSGINTAIDVSELPEGMYFLRIGKNVDLQTIKFVKATE